MTVFMLCLSALGIIIFIWGYRDHLFGDRRVIVGAGLAVGCILSASFFAEKDICEAKGGYMMNESCIGVEQ